MLSWSKSYCWDGNKSLCSRVLLAACLFPLFTCISVPFSWMVMFSLNLPSIQSRTCLEVFLTPATYLYWQLWKANPGKPSCNLLIQLGEITLHCDTWILSFPGELLAYSAQKHCMLRHPHLKKSQESSMQNASWNGSYAVTGLHDLKAGTICQENQLVGIPVACKEGMD